MCRRERLYGLSVTYFITYWCCWKLSAVDPNSTEVWNKNVVCRFEARSTRQLAGLLLFALWTERFGQISSCVWLKKKVALSLATASYSLLYALALALHSQASYTNIRTSGLQPPESRRILRLSFPPSYLTYIYPRTFLKLIVVWTLSLYRAFAVSECLLIVACSNLATWIAALSRSPKNCARALNCTCTYINSSTLVLVGQRHQQALSRLLLESACAHWTPKV